ncbi:hypothetical protein [Borrelia turicatae]|uniref:hypothetical protein n=1 Tax=Borrelia turicatae TaxID=142 RepID=UPI001FF29DCF|nr:hypothetical protein [Borrelia turicatae]UPA15676.1 hypothetical protein btBTE5EL_001383 [Borrelia turicatae]
MINITRVNNQRSEVEMQQFILCRQMVFKRFESFAYQSQEKLKGKQKQVSKISGIGCELPKIGKGECFSLIVRLTLVCKEKF